MLKNFKTTKVKLGDYQKLVRGDKEIPIWGMQDVITAMNASNYKDGKIRVTHGESYIQFAKFTENKTENCFRNCVYRSSKVHNWLIFCEVDTFGRYFPFFS